MMMISEVAHVLQTGWNGGDVLFTGVSTDSRTLKQGNLFVALAGEKYDGNQFVASAIENGAVAALINRTTDDQPLAVDIPVICVNDTRIGLGRLAAYWRNRFTGPVVGVTGSNGKTTVKEMIASILRYDAIHQSVCADNSADPVLATEGNLNNDIGVPQMLLRLRSHHRYAVIEMGMNHLGEIAYLTELTKPTIAVITNAGGAHIEGLGSVEAVAQAKAEILQGLDQNGTAVINADDVFAPLWRQCSGSRAVIDFGLHTPARVTAEYQTDSLTPRIKLKLPYGKADLQLNVPGRHNIYNALAAAAAACALHIDPVSIAAGLENFHGVRGRLQRKIGRHHSTLIDDTYNANPESVRAALAVLAATSGKKILVLGDMGELGQAAIDLHRSIGQEARRAQLDQLLTLGELSAYASREFGHGAQHFSSLEALLDVAEHLLGDDVTVLVKGSRFMKMEHVIQQLEAEHR
ncbi:UDP-N-acetylmuramoyl-tripeptide--D-alanyl-D-alanine ligase [Nitrosomonas sp. JL21]|uniref:UDP-N-acetylmuramoyl-tripeptide--D-alanyl-D- alanine ligase n=1 Tax=Nitrosomonas sp. JL21 TaxID=153949 RepID=UPI00136DB24A|nr:UDP-N-acetylmuramoyl-tripeptide--D-alanyl-D-alanine ligase [Nitrosomonas sp. JL21]MBL8497152.1 UDP-N-acetylmuramoyl-tripeptide--D-alanyl-D-alanine ligase [Nitrosomonas sp.]MCC7092270.1 UDP-N-acetylmuramoyl-tripeptide--D-alanyl-D-alanine ligase [Nitrosomonas sp.]MXS76622.1 UDP-N-acetylmuramoyl-tripeptide--D-alanyl-D-alanine ligase [Nitrosomonas sp. JL21]